jgi:hypothetical protein
MGSLYIIIKASWRHGIMAWVHYTLSSRYHGIMGSWHGFIIHYHQGIMGSWDGFIIHYHHGIMAWVHYTSSSRYYGIMGSWHVFIIHYIETPIVSWVQFFNFPIKDRTGDHWNCLLLCYRPEDLDKRHQYLFDYAVSPLHWTYLLYNRIVQPYNTIVIPCNLLYRANV